MLRQAATHLPDWAQAPLRRVKHFAVALPYRGANRRCPVCGNSSRKFMRAGTTPRDDAYCVFCGALERHRFVWLYMQTKTDLFDGRRKRVLHVAPEPCLEPRLRAQLGDGYLTADLFSQQVMVKMDVTDIQYPDGSFDVIYCSHVLEHVVDDKKALREFFRVLKPGGWAILLVPIEGETTVEDPSVTDPAERLRLFGQEDHVRRYGRDYQDRLAEAGFDVQVTTVRDMVAADQAVYMGLTAVSGDVYYCTKAGAARAEGAAR